MRRGMLLMAMLAVSVVGAGASDPPAVMLDLGPVVPTPAPTPEEATRRRLITTITVQNVAHGDSVISFEATDVADKGKDKFQTMAAARYSLTEAPPKLKALRSKIIAEIRDLERDLLEYAEIAGPPKDRPPVLSAPSDGGSR